MSQAASPQPIFYRLWMLVFLVGFWPVVIVNLSLLLSISVGELPPAFPYIDGTVSVSAAARQDPTIYWFRIAMMPYALVLAVFWWLNHRWLAAWAPGQAGWRRSVVLSGLIGASFLLLYVSFLGTDGVIYSLLRRFGATLYFACTALAQLLSLRVLWRSQLIEHPDCRPWAIVACTLSASLLVVGLISIPLPMWVPEGYRVENVVEWNFGLLMMAWFAAVAVMWRRTGFGFQLGTYTSLTSGEGLPK